MRIACPECNAAYDVPPTQLVPGRPTRCARCGAVWTPVATEDARPPIPAAVVEPRAPAPPPEAPPEPEPAPEPTPTPLPFPATAPVPVAVAPAADAFHDRDGGHLVPPVPEPSFDDAPDAPLPRPATLPAMRRGGGPVLVGWVLTAVVLLALGVLAVSFRDAVVATWPPSERAYRAVGLPP